ncbi:glutamate receptor ionotropic, delta-2-like isoform X2 [Scylla paramamosain]|uniref:glutamate receptor ionotropic, delta-2-like isoform X2 n=1 Tax=Scylla paramamosain TaxID=85552 RepID=UPI003082F9DC
MANTAAVLALRSHPPARLAAAAATPPPAAACFSPSLSLHILHPLASWFLSSSSSFFYPLPTVAFVLSVTRALSSYPLPPCLLRPSIPYRLPRHHHSSPATSPAVPPFLEITETGGRGGVKGRGMSWDVMNALASYFNFTPEPVAAYDNLVGVKGENGWKGALQLIANEEAEFTLMPVTVTEVRKEVVEFSHLLGTTSFGMLVKRPEYTPKPDALLKPFNKEVWFWIIGSMATMGPLIYFIIVFRVRLCRGDPKLTRIMPFDQCCWFVYGAMMKQGSVLKPISDSSRILFATWWLFIMIVTSFYTANLTAFLTFNGLQLPINEVADLEKHSDITWLASRDGAVVDVITSHPQLEILRELKKKGRGRYIDSREEALALVRAGDHVYIDDVQVLEYLIQEDFKRQQREELNQTCNFYTSELERGGELTFWYGFGFKNGSEYTDLFNGFFRRLSIFGILNFLRNSATASSPVCTLPKGFKDRALENKDLYTTYVLYAIGIVASLLALLTESFFRRAMRQTHNLAMATRKTFSDRFNSPPIKVTPSRTGPTQTWNSGLPPCRSTDSGRPSK